MATTRDPLHRGTRRLAVDEQSGGPRDSRCSDRGRDAGIVYRREPALTRDLQDGQSQPRARQQRWIVLRLCLVWYDSRTALWRLPNWIPIRQAWLRSGGEAWTASLPGPCLHVLRESRYALDEARPNRPGFGASCLRHRKQDRRPHLRGLQLQQPEHESYRNRGSARRCATRSRKWDRLRAEGAVWSRHRHYHRAARINPD